ncbi:hypothetical protein [Yokenella regensburgei]|uniref:hypothetical protein n=1 Tax=Yokenella regensburgei TaxID=158877 RepID=UPI0013763B1D|nr:hypothetical protein [Yokenella regensburgei]KAF1366971.1 hypothetical protein FHR25_004507 [Yokenella regensburgei]
MADFKYLDYCRIDRAAKVIGCEIDDLVHLGANNKIQLSLMLDMAYSHFYSDMDIDYLNESYKILPVYNNEFRMITNHSMIYDELLSDESIFSYDSGDHYSVAYGSASGLWDMPSSDLKKIELHGFFDEGIILTPSGEIKLNGFLGCLLPNSNGVKIKVNDLWITKEYIEDVLQGNFERADIQKRHETNGLKSIKISKVVSERHAKKREVVLIAAIYCKEKYPDECSCSIRSWANCIERNATKILYKNGDAPLSLDRIERILGKAISGKMITN